MTKFCKAELRDGRLEIVSEREISQQALRACPHFIFVAEHYRDDSSCKCDDPSELVMREWGYRWSKKAKRWV